MNNRRGRKRQLTLEAASSSSSQNSDTDRSIDRLTAIITTLVESNAQQRKSSVPVMRGDMVPYFNPDDQALTVTDWISKVDELKEVFGWSEEAAIYFGMSKLKGMAEVWYKGLSSIKFSWEEWKGKLVQSFPSKRNFYADLQEMMSRTKRNDENYCKYFYEKSALLSKCEISGEKAVSCIIGGIFDNVVKTGAMAANHQSPEALYENPKFSVPIRNVTVPVGREAILSCLVEDLGSYKVAWLRVDTQTILTIHTHVITKNPRIGVTDSERKTWFLHIKGVKKSDKGWYMCQINTDPMKSQLGYLDIVVPPDILDYRTSTDIVVAEGSSVNLRCFAQGTPEPSITWRRETGELIKLSTGEEVSNVDGPELNLTRVSRQQMGPYLCIASNGVPPSVSKRIMLIVHFPPMMWIKNQLVGAYEDQHVTLECHSEAFPKAINYWTNEKNEIFSRSGKYEVKIQANGYQTHMQLIIHTVELTDYGSYKCVAKNSLGETDGTIQVFTVPKPSQLSNGISETADLIDRPSDSLYRQDKSSSCEQPKVICVVFLLAFILFLL